MVNAGMVNASASGLPRAHFCVFFFVSGRYVLLRNPVKYTRIFGINQSLAAPVPLSEEKATVYQ
jgi:hypothetical protein